MRRGDLSSSVGLPMMMVLRAQGRAQVARITRTGTGITQAQPVTAMHAPRTPEPRSHLADTKSLSTCGRSSLVLKPHEGAAVALGIRATGLRLTARVENVCAVRIHP